MSKPNTFHATNLPAHILNEDGTLPEGMQIRKVSRATLVTEETDQNYYYRGRRFFQDTGTPKGCYGRFKMGSHRGATTLAEMLNLIDNLFT